MGNAGNKQEFQTIPNATGLFFALVHGRDPGKWETLAVILAIFQSSGDKLCLEHIESPVILELFKTVYKQKPGAQIKNLLSLWTISVLLKQLKPGHLMRIRSMKKVAMDKTWEN